MDLNDKNTKKSIFKAQFNSLEINEKDPTILKGTVIIHDFEKSWNNQVITEEVCAENMNTLIGKRIVCKYISSEDNNGLDALTDHEEKEGKDRIGNEMIITDTIAIGFIENVYIDNYTNENGDTKRVLFGNVVIWNDDKYANIVGLLQEWINRGIKIHMSVEYLYCNYNVIEGIEYLQTPVLYVAHTLLNSEERNEYAEILPAYDCATLINLNERKKWNKTISQLSKTNNKSENKKSDLNIKNNSKEDKQQMENIFLKSMNGISFGETRSRIYEELSKVMIASEYEWVWLSNYDIYDDYFVYETRIEDEWVTFKVPYSRTEDGVVTIEYDKKAKAEFKTEWVAVSEVTEVQNSLNTKEEELTKANEKVTDLEKQLNEKEESIISLNEKINSTNTEKTEIETKFNDVTDKLTSLNSMVENMKPIVDEYNKEQFEKELNEMKSTYEKKFNSVNALEKFETDEVQELIKKALNKNEEGKNAITSLNKMVVDSITFDEEMESETKPIKELCSKQENLIPNDSFEARYGF